MGRCAHELRDCRFTWVNTSGDAAKRDITIREYPSGAPVLVHDDQGTNLCFDWGFVDDNAAVGIMNGKGALDGDKYLYFYLERV